MARPTKLANTAQSAQLAPAFVSLEVPLYYQLASVLRDQIVAGPLGHGDRLPTEAELVETYGVSRITVRQALQNLEADGLIRRKVGRGTFVTEQPHATAPLLMEGSLDDLMSMGLATKVKVIDLQTIRATPELAKILRIDSGSPVTRCTRLRFHQSQPFSHIVTELPDEIARRFTRNDWNGSILQVLDRKLRIPVRDAEQTIRAALANTSLARLLETRIGAPLLAVERVVLTDDGVPVERVRTHYRSDLYSLKVHLNRTRANAAWSVTRKKAR